MRLFQAAQRFNQNRETARQATSRRCSCQDVTITAMSAACGLARSPIGPVREAPTTRPGREGYPLIDGTRAVVNRMLMTARLSGVVTQENISHPR